MKQERQKEKQAARCLRQLVRNNFYRDVPIRFIYSDSEVRREEIKKDCASSC